MNTRKQTAYDLSKNQSSIEDDIPKKLTILEKIGMINHKVDLLIRKLMKNKAI